MKNLINGYITNVFIHFLYPDWERKRELRYEILFETGAKGIFTGDMIKRVWDTDIDIDQKIMQGCVNSGRYMECSTCGHAGVHEYGKSYCDEVCKPKNKILMTNTNIKQEHIPCQPLIDYSNFMDTTHGKGLNYADKKD